MAALPPKARSERARIGGMRRGGVPEDDPRFTEARRNFRAAVLANRAERLMAEMAEMRDGGDV